ncbi:hypothetical protein E2C01_040384 [Portunus trituberculatus]|uniref:Uncharacterized protein n=1 Tax=Portunus trituberculatus TaxID=210409 RepID=A0A5B7FN63_PORTR|nr:hypothetical protein [Portunus trituberculatus]
MPDLCWGNQTPETRAPPPSLIWWPPGSRAGRARDRLLCLADFGCILSVRGHNLRVWLRQSEKSLGKCHDNGSQSIARGDTLEVLHGKYISVSHSSVTSDAGMTQAVGGGASP